jgi:4-amino-4-deoxy-L-arabinose transferase-like glycosyltransferase
VAREVILRADASRLSALQLGVIALIIVRGVVAAVTPLSFDEAYYWMWSKHLAAGYYDHPPAVAYVIRAGTALFEDTSFGVRFVPWLLSIVATWAVWRAGMILLREQAGALAALFFNVMPMIGVEGLVATPDAPEMAAAALVLYALAKIAATGRGEWWLAAGIAAGFALLSKYTGFFLGLGILVWLAAVPKERRWFFSFWPYLGGAIALLMFVPVILWNARHDWVSFALQFGRVENSGFTLRFLGEFLAGQIGLATPFIIILAFAGIAVALRGRGGEGQRTLALAASVILPATLYFIWHSLHDRVQGNWPSFLYPAVALAAAATCLGMHTERSSLLMRVSRASAIPLAVVMIAAAYAQALFDVVPIREPVSRLLAFNMAPVVRELEDLRTQQHAGAIVTTSYALAAWFSFYMPGHVPVVQLNERFRYLDQPQPARSVIEGPLLYVTEARNDQSAQLAQRFADITPVARIDRTRGGAIIDQYAVYRVEGLKGDPFD